MLTDEHQTAKREAGGLQADVPAIITRVGLDDWSSVRHVHMLSFSRLIGPSLSDGEAAVETYKAVVAAPEHTEALQAANLYVAWVDGYMTGTCGWLPVGDRGTAARLTAVYVDPTFTRLGIGRRLVQAAEVQAYTAGSSMLTWPMACTTLRDWS